MIFKRFPWRIFWLSLLTQLAVFNTLYGIYCLILHLHWDGSIILLGTLAGLVSTFIFIRPVYLLAISLKDQKANLHREREETQAFLTSIQEAVVTFGLDKKILFYNTRFASLFVGAGKSGRTKSFENVFANVELLSNVNNVIGNGQARNLTISLPTLLDVVVPGPGDYWPRLRPVLALTDVFMPNEDEATLITGESDPWRQAEAFRAAGVRTAMITRGGHGCVIISDEGRFQAEAHCVPFVDGTGSGDAFVSGYILGLLRGNDLLDCVRMGSAMGASCVRSTGATTGVFNVAELTAFVAEHPLKITKIEL